MCSRDVVGNLALHSAEEPDDLRATTGTVEVPAIREINVKCRGLVLLNRSGS